MKKLFFSLIVMMMTMSVMAQMPQFNPEDMVKQQVDEMKTKCKLDDKQYKAVYDLQLASQKQMMAEIDSIQNAGGDMFAAFDMGKMQKRQEEMNNKIKGILNAEQYKAYEELQKERRQRFQNFGGGF